MNEAAALADRLALPGIDAIVPFRVPLITRFRGVQERHGLLVHGPFGWGEWAPFDEYDDAVAAVWLAAAIDAACTPPPPARRDVVPVNVTVPAVDPDTAGRMVAESGCATAKVKVAEPGHTLADDVARVRAVRRALEREVGARARIRIDANAAWQVDEAVKALSALSEASGGLEYAEQPCATLEELAQVRTMSGVKVAADETIRRDHADPALVRDAVDVAVIKVAPSGGVTAAFDLARTLGLPAVVSSALDTSVGLGAGVRLAAALPTLPYACGLGTALLLAEDVVDTPLRPAGGVLPAAGTSGLSLRDPLPSVPKAQVAAVVERCARASAALQEGV